MILVLTFGVVLLLTVALSGLAARTVLSTALVFLVAGALVGPGVLGLIEVRPDGPIVRTLADSEDVHRAVRRRRAYPGAGAA